MADDWERLAGAIRASRTRLRLTQKELAAAAGVAHNTIKNLESGHFPYATRPRKLPDVAHALGWTPGSVDAVLAGGDPTVSEPEPQRQVRDVTLPEGMPERVREAIQGGAVVEAKVLEMPGERPGMRMVTLLMRDEDAVVDPEEVRANLAKWDRLQREAQRITIDADGTSGN